MKKILIFALLSIFSQCSSQKIQNMIPKVDSKIERFDIEKFNKNEVRGSVTIKSDDSVILEDKQSYGYIKQLYKNDFFCYTYLFH